MDISQEESLEIYQKISKDFNEVKIFQVEEIIEVVNGRDFLYSVLFTLMGQVATYSYLTGKQVATLLACIMKHFIPALEILIIKEQEIKIAELNKEIERLNKLILSDGPWNEIDVK